MSADAERAVQAAGTHLKLKGSKRALLDTIAKRIPEGQTMTAPTSLDEWAALTGYDRRTMQTAQDLLVALRLVRLVGAGRGLVASYELLLLAGTGPDPALPLRADLRPVAPRRTTPPDRESPDLFDTPIEESAPTNEPAADPPEVAARAYTVRSFFLRWRGNIRSFFLRTLAIVTNVGSFFVGSTGVVTNVGSFFLRWRATIRSFFLPALPLDVDDARARGTYVLQRSREVVLGARARANETPPEEADDEGEVLRAVKARAGDVEAFLDWFASAYATSHHGARYTVERAPDGGRIDNLLAHGRTVDRLKAMTQVMWTLTSDGIPKSERWYIAERVPVRNIWLLHKKADFLDLEVSLAQAQADTPPAHRSGISRPSEPNIWTHVLERVETKVNRHSFYTWFRPTTLVEDRGDVIEVAKLGDSSELFADWLRKHYAVIVQEAMDEVRPGTRVEFVIVDMTERKFG